MCRRLLSGDESFSLVYGGNYGWKWKKEKRKEDEEISMNLGKKIETGIRGGSKRRKKRRRDERGKIKFNL